MITKAYGSSWLPALGGVSFGLGMASAVVFVLCGGLTWLIFGYVDAEPVSVYEFGLKILAAFAGAISGLITAIAGLVSFILVAMPVAGFVCGFTERRSKNADGPIKEGVRQASRREPRSNLPRVPQR